MRWSLDSLPVSTQGVVLILGAAALAAGLLFCGIPGVLDSGASLSAKKHILETQVDERRSKITAVEGYRGHQTEIVEQIDASRAMIKTLYMILPDEPKTHEFRTAVDAAGAASGIHVRSIEAQALVPREHYVEMPFKVQADGTYHSLSFFFDRLSELSRIVRISDLLLVSPVKHSRGDFRLRPDEFMGATCVVTTYFKKRQPR